MSRLMLECALRAALVALGTAGALQLLRVKSPRARHGAWAGVMVLMLLLPAWTAWGPRASVRLLPAAPAPVVSASVAFAVPTLMPMEPAATAAPVPPAFRWNWRMSLACAYLLGVSILLTRLILGTLRARTLVRRSVADGGRLTNPSCATPITVGWLRPAVILPSGWRHWPVAQLDAVLTHEGEHVRRRDPLMQWLALLNRAIFWFHPLAWWLERRLSALAEEACDAAVLARGHNPYDYSGYLLELARSVGRSGVRINVLGMAMPGSSLPRRIRQIVGQTPAPRISRVRALCLAVACVTVSAVFAAATVDRQQFVPDPPLPPAPPAAAVAPLPPAPPEPAATTPLPPTPPQPPAPPAPPVDPFYRDRRLLVFYFDLRGAAADVQARAVSTATTFVRQQMGPSDLVSVVSANAGDIRVLQDFTNDRDGLTSVIQRMPIDFSAVPDAGQHINGLRTAIQMLGILPEKKVLIYFALPTGRQSPDDAEMAGTVNAAVRANVSVYPIDVRGLVTILAPYRLAPSDIISVSMPEEPNFSGTFTISSDGMILMPLLGYIKVAGLTTLELQASINQRASTFLRDAHSTVNVVTMHAPPK